LAERTWEEKAEIVRKSLYLNAPKYEIKVEGKVAVRKGSSSSGSGGQVALEEVRPRWVWFYRLLFWFTRLLPRVCEVVLLKEVGVHFHLLRYRMVVPAGTEVESIVYVPAGEVWEIWGEKHDVPSGVFEHGCWKDGMTMFESMLIEGDNLVMEYRVPFVIRERIRGLVKNVTAADETFRLSVERVMYPRKAYRSIVSLVRPFAEALR